MDLRLTDYRQVIKFTDNAPHYAPVKFSGVDPVLKREHNGFKILSQSGYAVGWRVQVKEQLPLFPDTLLAPADVQVEMIDNFLWKTTWSYFMAVADDQVIDWVGWTAWPETIEINEPIEEEEP